MLQKYKTILVNKYLTYQANKLNRKILNFQKRFERDMKRNGISLVAMKDPKKEGNILLEFVFTHMLESQNAELKAQDDLLNAKGDEISKVEEKIS